QLKNTKKFNPNKAYCAKLQKKRNLASAASYPVQFSKNGLFKFGIDPSGKIYLNTGSRPCQGYARGKKSQLISFYNI
ncbi:MAG TPA: hypothetical protein PKX19_09730, partial [Bacillota bacterium]|nr:hypothetical protein [Bacillota bacterium]